MLFVHGLEQKSYVSKGELFVNLHIWFSNLTEFD